MSKINNKILKTSFPLSDSEEDKPPQKKIKLSHDDYVDSREDYSWSLGQNSFINVQKRHGKVFIDIRKFQDVDGELKPGRRGIKLSINQWNMLKDLVDNVDSAINKEFSA